MARKGNLSYQYNLSYHYNFAISEHKLNYNQYLLQKKLGLGRIGSGPVSTLSALIQQIWAGSVGG